MASWPKDSLSLAEARRIALSAQGFGTARATKPIARGAILGGVRRLGVLQLDSVNVVCRAHYLPLFARLGMYDRPTLDAAAWSERPRELFEYWGHEARWLRGPRVRHPDRIDDAKASARRRERSPSHSRVDATGSCARRR